MDTPLTSVMTANPACCTGDTPLTEVARMMLENDCGEIPVVEAGRPIGVVTDRDITVRMVAEGRDTTSACASDCMTTPVTTVPESGSLADCCAAMESAQIRRMPVVDMQGRVVGVVAQADIALNGSADRTAEVVQEISRPC